MNSLMISNHTQCLALFTSICCKNSNGAYEGWVIYTLCRVRRRWSTPTLALLRGAIVRNIMVGSYTSRRCLAPCSSSFTKRRLITHTCAWPDDIVIPHRTTESHHTVNAPCHISCNTTLLPYSRWAAGHFEPKLICVYRSSSGSSSSSISYHI
jgi:hypothetical protein